MRAARHTAAVLAGGSLDPAAPC